MTVVSRVGFVGMGVMGAPMASHLVKSGMDVTVWNRTPAKSLRVAELGAKVASNLADLASECDLVFLCVERTEDVEQCLSEMTGSANSGTLFVDHSTISPSGARRIHENLERTGLNFLDAPITGGSVGAQKGQLTIFCGGSQEDFDRAKLAMVPYTKRAELVGGPGAGQTMKLANQIAVGGALLALCESLAFAKRAGLDIAQTRDMLSGGAAGSWAFENYGPKILNDDWSPGFSIKNQRKDFGYTIDFAEEIEANVPGTKLVDRMLAVLENEGFGEETTAALYRLMVEGADGQCE